jgi:hypothetical protein
LAASPLTCDFSGGIRKAKKKIRSARRTIPHIGRAPKLFRFVVWEVLGLSFI